MLAQELQSIHSAETQLSRALPRLARSVESGKLRRMMEQRVAQGERILQDVDSALKELEQRPGRRRNVAAEGLINDAREHLEQLSGGPALDSTLIGSIQKTEHYCIAAWGTAKSLAEAVGQRGAARAMERALREGKALDEKLTDLAEQEVTPALFSGQFERFVQSRSGRGGAERRASM